MDVSQLIAVAWPCIAGLISGAIGALVVWRVRERGEMAARAFVLTDEAGAVRARLSLVNGGPSLALYHGQGQPGAIFALWQDEAALGFYDTSGRQRAVLSFINREVGLTVSGVQGEGGASFAYAEGHPCLALLDAQGQPLRIAPLDAPNPIVFREPSQPGGRQPEPAADAGSDRAP
jgi:hypothetical protein